MTAIRSRWLELLAIVALAASLVRSFTVQADVTQGDVQRLMYVHVPSAWLAFLAFGVTVFASAAWLRTRQGRWAGPVRCGASSGPGSPV
jgi:heme exporter protein C